MVVGRGWEGGLRGLDTVEGGPLFAEISDRRVFVSKFGDYGI